MAVTVTLAVDQSVLMVKQPCTVTATFVNGGNAAVQVTGLARTNPSQRQPLLIDDYLDCVGISIPANSTLPVNWDASIDAVAQGLVPPCEIHTFNYQFILSDGTVISPPTSPQIAVYPASAFTNSQLAGFPTVGSVSFNSNTQSGFLAVISKSQS